MQNYWKLIVNPLILKKSTEVSPLKKVVNGLTEVVPNYGIVNWHLNKIVAMVKKQLLKYFR